MKERLIAGLDLGSSAIRLAVGQVSFMQDKRPTINLIGAVEVESRGISKGGIMSLEDSVTAISSCLELAERQIGLPITDTHIALGGTMMKVLPSKGVIGVSRVDGEILEDDCHRVLESARSIVNPANNEILHTIATRFTVDGQEGIKDPVGMQGIRLEADVFIIQGLSSHVRNLTNAVIRTNVDVAGLVYAPIATAEAVLLPRQKELGVILLDIGATTTAIAVYEDGDLLHSTIIPIGSDHVTSDIAIGLRTSLEIAEICKRNYISAVPEVIDEDQMIDLADLGGPESELVSPRFMSEVAHARVEELFEKVEEELEKIERSGMLPAGVVLTGGGAKLHGIAEVAKATLRLPVSVSGVPDIATPLGEVAQDPAFSTAIGAMLWGFESEKGDEPGWSGGGGSLGGSFVKKISAPIKKIFKSFIP
jgi:cell division protein FtsA